MNTRSRRMVKRYIIWFGSFSTRWKHNFIVANEFQPLLSWRCQYDHAVSSMNQNKNKNNTSQKLNNCLVLDMSQPSLSGMGERDDRERDEPTPPISPFIGSEGTSGTAKSRPLYTQKSASSRKYPDSSLDADDTESELVAIPESDLSEGTLHNSVHGSFDDELAQPLKGDQSKGKVTTANLATAQVALTTIGMSERHEEKPEKPEKPEKKTSRLFMKLNSLDRIGQKHSSTDSSKITTKCSVQEGVRMMVTPSIFNMTPQLPVESTSLQQTLNIQQQAAKESEPTCETKEIKDVSEVDGSKSAIGTLLTEASASVAKQICMGPMTSGTVDFLFFSRQFCFVFFFR